MFEQYWEHTLLERHGVSAGVPGIDIYIQYIALSSVITVTIVIYSNSIKLVSENYLLIK